MDTREVHGEGASGRLKKLLFGNVLKFTLSQAQ